MNQYKSGHKKITQIKRVKGVFQSKFLLFFNELNNTLLKIRGNYSKPTCGLTRGLTLATLNIQTGSCLQEREHVFALHTW